MSVTDAWHAVGVGTAWVNQTYGLYATYSQDCNSVALTANFPETRSIIWSTTNGLLLNGNSAPYTQFGNTITVNSPYGFSGSISGLIHAGCNTTEYSFCPCIGWENPAISWIYSTPLTGEPLQAEVNPPNSEASSYQWFVNGQLIETTTNTFLSTYNWPCVEDGEGLSVIAVASCGATAPVYGGNYSALCNGYYMSSNISLFPNPASSEVSVQLDESVKDENQINKNKAQVYFSEITQIKIIDKMGTIKKVIKFGKGNKKATLIISELKPDLYYLEITDGIHKIRKPLIINK